MQIISTILSDRHVLSKTLIIDPDA